jgi:hypothetical protein
MGLAFRAPAVRPASWLVMQVNVGRAASHSLRIHSHIVVLSEAKHPRLFFVMCELAVTRPGPVVSNQDSSEHLLRLAFQVPTKFPISDPLQDTR